MEATIRFVIITAIILMLVYGISHFFLKKLGRDPRNILPSNFVHRVKFPLIILFIAIALQAALVRDTLFAREEYYPFFNQLNSLLFIFAITWFIIAGIRITKRIILRKYDISVANNLRARKYMTQYNILERILIAIVIVFSIGIALLTFEGVQEIGVSVLTSAGIAGIILGLSAQKMIGTLLAGIQIAITQPIRVDDVVIVEGEWGRIEEIRLTYVVVNIWDKRRMVLPTTYFIEKPFQNWTRNSSDILGTVFLYTDYYLPVDEIRKEQTRLLHTTDLWDGKVNVVQVTETSERTMEVRCLVSAKDSGTAFDLRVFLRENLITFIKENFPESLPTARVELKKKPLPES